MVNPDFYTLWNHRKELLLAQQFQSTGDGASTGGGGGGEGGGDESGSEGGGAALNAAVAPCARPPRPLAREVLASELALTAGCIKKQPKSYGAWHHRLWCVNGLPPAMPLASSGGGTDGDDDAEYARGVLAGELDLCGQLLELDQRNFHCWAYRLQVTGQKQTGKRMPSKVRQNVARCSDV